MRCDLSYHATTVMVGVDVISATGRYQPHPGANISLIDTNLGVPKVVVVRDSFE
jgi:hypothetical protein